MRFNELFEEKVYEQSNASALAKSLIGKVSDPDAIKKATDYLVGLANQIIKAKDKQVDQQQQSREEPTPLAQQSQEQEPTEPAKESLGEAIDANKKVALDAIEAIAAAGDENALNQVIAFLKGAELKELAGAAIQNNISQGIKGNLDQKLSDIVAGTNTSFEEKENFLKQMASSQGRFFDGSVLIQQPTGNLYQVFDKVPVLNQIYRKLALELRGAMGYGPDQGPGEFLLALTGQGVDLADKSDLILVDGKGVEVKADGTSVSAKTGKRSRSGGRLYSTSGYGTASTARLGMFKAMVDNGVPAEVMKQYGWPVKEKGVDYPINLNFNAKGVKNLNSLFSQYMDRAGVQEVMRAMVNGLYTELPEGMSDKFINAVNNDGTIDYKTMMTELIILAHLYYKAQEGHDYIMVFNTHTGDYVMMGDEAQTRKLLQQGVVRYSGGMDFFDDRSKGTPQLLTNI